MPNEQTCYRKTVSELSAMTGSEIADQLLELRPDTGDSEYQSWRASVPALVAVIHNAGLDNLTLALEYETPIGSSRIDAILLGGKLGTDTPLALLFELKQWSRIEENRQNAKTTVCICLSADQGLYGDRLHPVQQTRTYARHLAQNHSNVATGRLEVLCCQFLHNFGDKQSLFKGSYQRYRKWEGETYVKGDEQKLRDFLAGTFSPVSNENAVSLLIDGHYILGDVGYRGLKQVLDREENAVMLADQIEVSAEIWEHMVDHRRNPENKTLIVVSGVPGTGKTVLGFHILYMYYHKFHEAPGESGACVFSLPRSKTLSQVIAGESGVAPVFLDRVRAGSKVVVVDEAHRINNVDQTMSSLFAKAGMVIVLQDDRQRIRLSEKGTRERFLQYARQNNIRCHDYNLKTQMRSGFMGNYVDNLDRLLYERTQTPAKQEFGLEVVVWDSPDMLDARLRQLAAEGHRVKWYAPYCWDWTHRTSNRDICIAVDGERFEKAWNPEHNQYDWFLGRTEESLDQVGCIYTAQGLEYDYVGVIWWNDLMWDEASGEWRINLRSIRDVTFVRDIVQSFGGTLQTNNTSWTVQTNDQQIMRINQFLRHTAKSLEDVKELVFNIYRILLTRAKKGVYIWFRDACTKEYFQRIMEANHGGEAAKKIPSNSSDDT